MNYRKKSVGHLAFERTGNETAEWLEIDGQLYRADADSPIHADGRRTGRWECSAEHAKRYRNLDLLSVAAAALFAKRQPPPDNGWLEVLDDSGELVYCDLTRNGVRRASLGRREGRWVMAVVVPGSYSRMLADPALYEERRWK